MPDDPLSIHWSTNKALILSLLIVVSAFAASSETALFSLNRLQIKRIKDRSKNVYNRLRTLLSRPSRLLILILLMNETVNISISSIIADFFESNSTVFLNTLPYVKNNLSPENTWLAISCLSILCAVPVLLFFGEITPKIFAAKMNRSVATMNSKVLIILYKVLFPLLWLLDLIITQVLKRFRPKTTHQTDGESGVGSSLFTENDFMTIMEEGRREGTVRSGEEEMIRNILDFDDTRTFEIMTPLKETFSVSANAKVKDTANELRKRKFARVPVYEKSKNNIVGILYLKDLLKLQDDPNLPQQLIKSLMSDPMTISADLRLPVLFRRFKETKTHMAICLDDKNKAIGVATMEDVLEDIFGEIEDEKDTAR